MNRSMNGTAPPAPAVQAPAAGETAQSAAQAADLLVSRVKAFVRATPVPGHRGLTPHDIADGLRVPVEIVGGVTQHLLKVGWLEPVGR